MSYRQLAAEYASAARAHLDLCRDDAPRRWPDDEPDPIPTDRQFMARLNLAKSCAMVSQAYSALVSIEPTTPQVVLTR